MTRPRGVRRAHRAEHQEGHAVHNRPGAPQDPALVRAHEQQDFQGHALVEAGGLDGGGHHQAADEEDVRVLEVVQGHALVRDDAQQREEH
jgi:hypothetical protein